MGGPWVYKVHAGSRRDQGIRLWVRSSTLKRSYGTPFKLKHPGAESPSDL